MIKKIVIVGIVLLVLAGLFLFLNDFDSPELGKALMERVNQASGLQIEAEEFRLNLLRGVVLEKVKAKGGSIRDLSLERLVFEHRFWPLLSGVVSVKRILLDNLKAEIAVVESGGKTAGRRTDKKAASQQLPGLRLEVEEIAIRDSALRLHQAGPGKPARTTVSVSDLDVTLQEIVVDPEAGSPIQTISGKGDISMGMLTLGTLPLRKVQGHLKIAKGEARMDPLILESDYGPLQAQILVDLNLSPFTYKLNAEGGPVDVNNLVGSGGGFGPARIDVKTRGRGTETRNLRGNGILKLDPGNLPSHQILTTVERLLGRQGLAGAAYQEAEAKFQMEGNRLTLEPISFRTDQLGLNLSGWADLEGALALDLVVSAPREGIQIQGLSPRMLDVLADDRGWIDIPMQVTGTRASPRVRPNTNAMLAQAKSGAKRAVTRTVEDLASQALGRLFRKKESRDSEAESQTTP